MAPVAMLAWLVLAQDALLKELTSDDFLKRQAAMESVKRLDDKGKKALAEGLVKSAEEFARDADAKRAKVVNDLLAKRHDEKTVKKKTQELRTIWEKIPFPVPPEAQKHVAELSKGMEELWKAQYPDLSTVMESETVRPPMQKFATMEEAAAACGEKKAIAEIKKMREALAFDERARWKLLLPDTAYKVLVKNEEIFKKAKGDVAMQECEYRGSITMNMFRVLFGSTALQIDPALSRECRKWSKFIDEGGKGGAYGVHSDSPNEDMSNGGPDGNISAWLLMTSDRGHIGAIFKWGSLGIGYHGKWWTWRG